LANGHTFGSHSAQQRQHRHIVRRFVELLAFKDICGSQRFEQIEDFEIMASL